MVLVHVIGLPGAGKTTLVRAPAEETGWPVAAIDDCRAGKRPTWQGELDAWLAWYNHIACSGWDRVLVESSGLNRRACRLEGVPALRVVKLSCDRAELLSRVAGRPAADWVYQDSLPDRAAFIDALWERFEALPADLEIDTGRNDASKTDAIAKQALEAWTQML